MEYKKMTVSLLHEIEAKGAKRELNKFKRLLNRTISEDDLECISYFLYEKASEMFAKNQQKKNTMRLFKMLYRKNIKRIIENIRNYDHRYDFVDYIIKTIGDNTEYSGLRSELYEVITFGLNNIDMNKSLSKNIDFEKVKTDETYAKSVEHIMVLFEEYNNYVRFFEDEEVKEDRIYGMNKMYEYIESRENMNPTFYKNSILLDYMLLNNCERYAQGNEAEPKTFEILKKCVDIRTKEPDFNIFTDQGISDLLQIINSDKIALSQVKELSEIITNNLKIKEIDREKAYDEAKEIMKQDGLDDSKTSELFGKIQLIKLSSKGRVPEDIIDYLISEILNEKSALHINSKKYKEYIGRTLESFGINHISKEISDKQSKFYFFREYIDVADSLGTQVENTIYLSEDIIPKTIEAINTIFHENTHIEQDYRFKSKDNYSYYEYMALKENILCKEIPVFQMNNYKLLFLEINARQRANLKMLKYFLNSERLKKRVSESKIKEIIEDYKKDTISYGGAYNKKEKADDTEEKDINVLFRETLKKEVIKEYPILALEYNEDCSEKTPQEIMEEIEESKDASKTILLTKILENNEIFKKSNMYRDVSYFIDYSAKNKTMEKIYGHVLTGTVLREIYNRYKEFDNLSQEEKEEFCKIIKKAQNKIINEPDSTFSRRISKCGKSRSSPIKTFQLMQKYVEMKVPEISINEEENQK